jgi:hypothetical protein
MEYVKDAQIVTDDFWYDLTDGGHIKPEKLLTNEADINKIKEAIKVLSEWKSEMEEKEILQYS